MMDLDLNKLIPQIKAAIQGDQAQSRTLNLHEMAGDASTRRYFRIHHGGMSYVVMYLPEDTTKSDEITKGGHNGDLPFLQVGKYLEAGGVHVPRVVYSNVSDRIVLLEDLGDYTVERLLAEQAHRKEELYKAAIREMVRMHKWAYEHPDRACVCFQRVFDRDLLEWEFGHFVEWGLEELTGKPLNRDEEGVFGDLVEQVVSLLTTVPQGFVHRDFQSRNLMVHQNTMAVIDFQDALIGPYIYDITALLRDSYVFFNENETDRFLAYFYELRKDAGLPVETRDQFKKTFHYQTIQRKLKDAGRFVFIDRVKHNPKFLPNIPRSLYYALDSMARFPEFDAAREMIQNRLSAFIGKAL